MFDESLVHKIAFTQHLNLIYTLQSLLVSDVCLTMKTFHLH